MNATSKPEYKVVKVLWADATSIDSWEHIADLPEDDYPCLTIGILVKTTKIYYYIANTIGYHTQDENSMLSTGVILIPRKWVLDMSVLEVPLEFKIPKQEQEKNDGLG